MQDIFKKFDEIVYNTTINGEGINQSIELTESEFDKLKLYAIGMDRISKYNELLTDWHHTPTLPDLVGEKSIYRYHGFIFKVTKKK